MFSSRVEKATLDALFIRSFPTIYRSSRDFAERLSRLKRLDFCFRRSLMSSAFNAIIDLTRITVMNVFREGVLLLFASILAKWRAQCTHGIDYEIHSIFTHLCPGQRELRL
jgi:hypothetical protein